MLQQYHSTTELFSTNIESILISNLDTKGFFYLREGNNLILQSILDSLGSVIYETDVISDKNSKKLVTSYNALDVHTDHHKADYIVWYCVEQGNGGESILVDSYDIFAKLSPAHQSILTQIYLMEHKVFVDDIPHYPLAGQSDQFLNKFKRVNKYR